MRHFRLWSSVVCVVMVLLLPEVASAGPRLSVDASLLRPPASERSYMRYLMERMRQPIPAVASMEEYLAWHWYDAIERRPPPINVEIVGVQAVTDPFNTRVLVFGHFPLVEAYPAEFPVVGTLEVLLF